jgi:hypothetical protein
LQQQLADMQEQLNRMVGHDGLANDGPARMYSTRAILNQIQVASRGLTKLWRYGGSTHHVVHTPPLLFNKTFNKTASHVNSVLVAGGEEHHVQYEGEMMIESPHGSKIFKGVLCVPSFVVNLLSTRQLDVQGKGALHKDSKVSI